MGENSFPLQDLSLSTISHVQLQVLEVSETSQFASASTSLPPTHPPTSSALSVSYKSQALPSGLCRLHTQSVSSRTSRPLQSIAADSPYHRTKLRLHSRRATAPQSRVSRLMRSFDATSRPSSTFCASPLTTQHPFAYNCGNTNNYAPSSKAQFKKSVRPMCHTDRGYKLATSLAQHRNKRNLKVLQNRGGSEEFERIMDIMDRRQQDLLLAREAKRHAASQLSMADEEFDDENCCAILPVQHAQQIERDRLQELLERQKEIEAMEAEIEEYSRLAEEEEAKMERDAQAAFSMRQDQNQVMQSESREPWDISDEDVEMSG